MASTKIYFLIGFFFELHTRVLLDQAASRKPHIILILADDLGWNDVSFHGSSQIITPNIDALAYNGIILNQHYVQALCTPSRAALLTGKYPIHTGMQHSVILEDEPWGLPLSEKLLPQFLKEAGYATHAVGKWHLGFFREAYTPTARGFDSHYGYWQGFQDYYDHSCKATFRPLLRGLDMRRNMAVDNSTVGLYSTDLFTEEAVNIISNHDKSKPLFLYMSHLAVHAGNFYEPFQAPDEEVGNFLHIQDPERRTYAGMLSKLDKSVGNVILALRKHGMLENSIVLFMADNGAPSFGVHSNKGSNYPLRGMKNTPWEGGVRGAAVAWSPLFKETQKVSYDLFHISDWLPTLCKAAGINIKDTTLDGVDQWDVLTRGSKSKRTEVLINIDHFNNTSYAALRMNDMKYVTGISMEGKANEWFGDHEDNDYPVKEILYSKVGLVLNGLKTKLQIKELHKGNRTNLYKESRMKILTEEKIYDLRELAKVKCNNRTIGSICQASIKPCLFNLTEDPCEINNLAETHVTLLKQLEETLKFYEGTVIPPRNQPSDQEADPMRWNNVWVPWYDELDKLKSIEHMKLTRPLISSTFVVSCLVGLAIFLAAGTVVAKTWVFERRSSTENLPECPKSGFKITNEREIQTTQSMCF